MTGRQCREGEGWLGSHAQQLKFQRDISEAGGFPLICVGSKPQVGLPSLQHQSWENDLDNIQPWKTVGFLSTRERQLEIESVLKGQCTKFCLQPLTLGCSRGRAGWTRDAWGESGAGGSGDRTEETAARSPVLSHTSNWRGISLKGNNSPTRRNYSAPPCGI